MRRFTVEQLIAEHRCAACEEVIDGDGHDYGGPVVCDNCHARQTARRKPPKHMHFWHNQGIVELSDGEHVTQWVCRGQGLDTCGALRNRPPGAGAPPRVDRKEAL